MQGGVFKAGGNIVELLAIDGDDNIMGFRQLHCYPKVFNDQGNLKAFPLRHPLRVYLWRTLIVSAAFTFLFEAYHHWTFVEFARTEFFQRDVPLSSRRKLNFSCENVPSIR